MMSSLIVLSNSAPIFSDEVLTTNTKLVKVAVLPISYELEQVKVAYYKSGWFNWLENNWSVAYTLKVINAETGVTMGVSTPDDNLMITGHSSRFPFLSITNFQANKFRYC